MSDVGVRRDAVIAAALQCERVWRSHSGDVAKERVKADLAVAVREYDAALKPDPWQLLEQAGRTLGTMMHTARATDAANVMEKIDAALAWRGENPDG